jgi:hydrophobic/amphiphilic exporter-1 (mainly G- bacteria), HAE1 family
LRSSSEKIQRKLQNLDALWNVKTSFEGAAPELHLRLNRTLADGLGVDINTIRAAIEAALDGLEVTTMYLGDESREVILKLPSINSQQLMNLTLESSEGKLFTLADIASLVEEPGAREILRHNQKRIAQVTAAINKGHTQAQAREQVQKVLKSTELPLGVTASLAGEEKERQRTVEELSWAALLALVLVFMVLAGSFESLLQPFSVLSAVPIALIGVAIVMLPQGQPLGIMAMLGLVVLVGVSVNDAILLAQTARSLSQQGIDTRTALARAAGHRLRPIIMTSATTVLSLLPMAIGSGEAAQLRSPLALTVIGGIIASTLGSLFVIPCIYLSLENLGHSLRIKKIN